MYASLMIWEATHRTLLWGLSAAILWMSAWYWYLRYDIRGIIKLRSAQRWKVDMATRTVVQGRKPVL